MYLFKTHFKVNMMSYWPEQNGIDRIQYFLFNIISYKSINNDYAKNNPKLDSLSYSAPYQD